MQLTKTALTFDLRLRKGQTRQFRGAVDEKIRKTVGDSDLFHNHDNSDGRVPSSYHHRYPLIQYQNDLDTQQAGLVGIQHGANALLETFLDHFDGELYMNNRLHTVRVQDFQHETVELAVLPEMHYYQLTQWLPMRSKHLQQWKIDDRLTTRIQLLEGWLANNILGFAKGIGWHIPERFEVILTDYRKGKKVHHRGGRVVQAFDVQFKCNLRLPTQIGLGTGASEGYGRLET